jgi:hypothetical protein
MEHAEYCRQLETYLCQKNGGHLIRIVGPAFERVCSWIEQGIPITVARRGIDRYCERQQSAPGRRRPVRIEFCEADILTVFDDWRRAVGSAAMVRETAPDATPATRRPPALAAHLDRVIARLIGRRHAGSEQFEQRVAALLSELDQINAMAGGSSPSSSRPARGEARTAILDRLAALDDELMVAARAEVDQATAAALRREAEQELSVFAARMPADARAQAIDAVFLRLLRESLGLPTIRYA